MYICVFCISVLRLKGVWFTGEDFIKQEEEICHNCLLLYFDTIGSSGVESVITKAESNQSGESLIPETAQLMSSFSSLQPKIFAQLQVLSSHLQNIKHEVLKAS